MDLLSDTFPIDLLCPLRTITLTRLGVEDLSWRTLDGWAHTGARAIIKHLGPWARSGRAAGALSVTGEGGLPDAEGLCVVALRARSGVHTFVSASEVGTDGAAALVVVKHTPWLAWQL